MSAEWPFSCVTERHFNLKSIFLGGGLSIDFQFQKDAAFTLHRSFFFFVLFKPKMRTSLLMNPATFALKCQCHKKKTKVFPLGKCVKRARYALPTSIKLLSNIPNDSSAFVKFSGDISLKLKL